MGNDDYSPTKRMTGGTLPATIWHDVMAYAHQGVELRPLPGFATPTHAPTIADATLKNSDVPRPVLLTRKGTDILVRVERLLDDANRALANGPAPAGAPGAQTSVGRADTVASALDRPPARPTQGN
jgi:penicillin-binding protein 1A